MAGVFACKFSSIDGGDTVGHARPGKNLQEVFFQVKSKVGGKKSPRDREVKEAGGRNELRIVS